MFINLILAIEYQLSVNWLTPFWIPRLPALNISLQSNIADHPVEIPKKVKKIFFKNKFRVLEVNCWLKKGLVVIRNDAGKKIAKRNM